MPIIIRCLLSGSLRAINSYVSPVLNNRIPIIRKSDACHFTSFVNCIATRGISNITAVPSAGRIIILVDMLLSLAFILYNSSLFLHRAYLRSATFTLTQKFIDLQYIIIESQITGLHLPAILHMSITTLLLYYFILY